jgi:hypothetical protein
MTSARLTGGAVGTGVSVGPSTLRLGSGLASLRAGGELSVGCGGRGVSVGPAVAAGTSVDGTTGVAVGWGVPVGTGVQVGGHVGVGPDVRAGPGVAVGARPNRSPQAATSPATAATAQPRKVRRDMFLPIISCSLPCNSLSTITSCLPKITKPPRSQTFASLCLPAASTRQ